MSNTNNNKSSSSTALSQWELENNITESDQIYKYDPEKQNAILSSRPWSQDPHYFKKVKMSALALLKMTMHATRGQPLEVMGLMQGKIDPNDPGTFIVMDSFALPVEGTETRVNAGAEAIEYMGQYVGLSEQVGRNENVVGWYHSHPGYGCWLSGIDVNTQLTNQKYQDPFLAVVIDPVRTVSAGKVEVGAFRTFPENYKNTNNSKNSMSSDGMHQSIPMDKIEDFGVYHDQYYSLEIEYFKSSADTSLLNLLWNKYWINILSGSPLVRNRFYTNQQVSEVAKKLDRAENEIGRNVNSNSHGGGGGGGAVHHLSGGGGAAINSIGRFSVVNMNSSNNSTTGTGGGTGVGGDVSSGGKSSASASSASSRDGGNNGNSGGGSKIVVKESELGRIEKDAVKLTVEVLTGVVTQVTKDALFNQIKLLDASGGDDQNKMLMDQSA